MIDFQEKSIDVICQHTKDCKIIPLRIRLEDEDGNLQTYNIKWYNGGRDSAEKKGFDTHGSSIKT